jgi:2-polyprenyl-6-methoxyphenol hydroxylase-like FAD-dependent oxidoreductase
MSAAVGAAMGAAGGVPPHEIVILGGGTAGWMAATLMQQHWGERVRITLIESPQIGIIGVGEGSTPTLRRFFEKVGIAEADWMPRCNATYKLNIRFVGWSPASGIAQYSHPFISQLDTFHERSFVVNCLTRRLGLDVVTDPGRFLLNGVLAEQKKGPQVPPSFPFRIEYGYHFDSALLGNYLGELAVTRGVRRLSTRVLDTERNEAGDLAALVCEDGSRIRADLFVDCSGFASVLLQQALGVGFRSFKENLFNDAAVVMPTASPAPLPVETVAHALGAGWCWHIPLTARQGNGYVYSSDFLTPEQAEQELRTHLGMLESPVAARHLKMKVGQVERHWSHNCLALGLSQGFIEPLEATALHLVQTTVERFIEHYDQGAMTRRHQDAFNRDVGERFERVRDYIVAHYKLNTRQDTGYWRANRDNMKLSEPLLQLLHHWYQKEDVIPLIEARKDASHFGVLSWHCMLAGYGKFPALAATQPGKGDLYLEGDVQAFLNGCSLNFSSHEHCLGMDPTAVTKSVRTIPF